MPEKYQAVKIPDGSPLSTTMLTTKQFFEKLQRAQLQYTGRTSQPAPAKLAIGPAYLGLWLNDLTVMAKQPLVLDPAHPCLTLAGLLVEYAPDMEPEVVFLLLDRQGGLIHKESAQ